MGQTPDRPIFYAAVAGDTVADWQSWRAGEPAAGQTSITYSAQFFELCGMLAKRGVVSCPPGLPALSDDRITFMPRRPRSLGRGWRYQLGLARQSLELLGQLIRARPSHAIIMDGVAYWALLTPARLFGVKLIGSQHTEILPPGPIRPARQIILGIEGWALGHFYQGFLAVSTEVAAQAARLTSDRLPIATFHGTYLESRFADVQPPVHPGAGQFRLFFAGRVEEAKGVFDLLDMMRALRAAGRDVSLDICGDGSALAELKRRVEAMELGPNVHVHGHTASNRTLALLSQSHAVIVPTRSTFLEGFNKVSIEAVLAHRPLVTSSACLRGGAMLAPAAVEAEVDNVDSYVAAIGRLIDDPAFYAARVAATDALRRRFFDLANGWLAAAYALIAGGATGGRIDSTARLNPAATQAAANGAS
ncbi:hypothetical protein ACFB49_04620 [Sphingomonas sp. DBB INV C78]|uniref:glycosyltransferase family 4 protein n=1 Tax=Sphingomonas sp. DBB INV C78 TaxID=3349434 RepID=UPI0036D25D8F